MLQILYRHNAAVINNSYLFNDVRSKVFVIFVLQGYWTHTVFSKQFFKRKEQEVIMEISFMQAYNVFLIHRFQHVIFTKRTWWIWGIVLGNLADKLYFFISLSWLNITNYCKSSSAKIWKAIMSNTLITYLYI